MTVGPATIARRSLHVELAPIRWMGAAMLGLGLVLPILPHDPGLPCPLRAMTGLPCPVCGMTTSVKATVHGHLGVAVAANPVGPLAVALAVVLLIRPRWRLVRLPLPALVVLTAVSWAWELHRFHWI